ncbi:hypothetical protein [Priestia megaterium]|uniref:hypothetical protein n=1 Tax=Priestia megaterium TaxID=1404 RepID=UPI0034575651
MLNKFAIKSPVLDSSEMFSNSKSFISQTKDVKQLEQIWNLTERLLAVDPKQGVEGAVMAMKELMSGDTQSMVERFEMPRKALNDIKNLPLDQQLKELDKLYNKMGMTNKLVTAMGSTSLGYITQIKEALSMKFRAVGFEALKSLKPIIVDIKNAVSDGKLDGFFNAMSTAFAFLGSEAAKFATYVKENWPLIKSNFQSIVDTLAPLGEALKFVYDKSKEVGNWIIQNWPIVQETIVGITTAVVAFKAGMAALTIIQTITTLLAAYRAGTLLATAAQLGFNVALLANPIGLVIAAIAALVAIGVVLYRNWDTIKAKTIELWNKMGSLKIVVLAMLGPFGALIAAGTKIYQNWDKIKAKAQQLWTKFGSLITKILAFSGPIGGLIAAGIKLCGNWDKVKAVGTSAFNAIGNVIDKVKGRFHAFTSAVSSFKMPNFKMPSVASTKAGMGPSKSKSKSKKNKSSYHGESYVPRNGMMYRLHQGERVLTKKENRQFAKGSGGGVTINLNGTTIREDTDVDKLAASLARQIYLAGEAGA